MASWFLVLAVLVLVLLCRVGAALLRLPEAPAGDRWVLLLAVRWPGWLWLAAAALLMLVHAMLRG